MAFDYFAPERISLHSKFMVFFEAINDLVSAEETILEIGRNHGILRLLFPSKTKNNASQGFDQLNAVHEFIGYLSYSFRRRVPNY
jgi:hypothetical protein